MKTLKEFLLEADIAINDGKKAWTSQNYVLKYGKREVNIAQVVTKESLERVALFKLTNDDLKLLKKSGINPKYVYHGATKTRDSFIKLDIENSRITFSQMKEGKVVFNERWEHFKTISILNGNEKYFQL